MVAIVPGVKDDTGSQWTYQSPRDPKTSFLIGSDGRVLETMKGGASPMKYRVEIRPTPAK
jgi:hypothetical protein